MAALGPSSGDAGVGQEWAGTWEHGDLPCTVRLTRVPAGSADRENATDAARRLTSLNHAHLVPVLAVLETGRGLAVVSAAVPSAISLGRLLARRPQLSPGEAVTIGLPIAQALAAAHAAGLGHGSLTAADILLEPNGRPHLAGVGIAELAVPRPGPDPDTGPADVNALAALLRDAISGAAGPDAAAVAVVVSTALVPDPAKRPTAAQLADALAHSTRPLPVQLAVPPPPAPTAARPASGGQAEDGGPAEPPAPRAPAPAQASRPPRPRQPADGPAGAPAGRTWEPRGGAAHPARRPLRRQLAVWAATVVAAAAAVAVIATVVAVAAKPAGDHGGAAAPPSQSAEQAWRDVLAGLEAARGRAFQVADPAALDDVDQNGSAVHTADLALMRDTTSRGAHVSQLTTRILALRVQQTSADQVWLVVTEQTGAYDFLDSDGAVLAHQDASAPARSDVTLVRTNAGWRIADRVPVG
ncbi:protein kinase [Pseudofrankia sp. DC12]|uniref:protein kinase n=1 Tax=Pseudofrankia sp. DC12 TaxID=683315 RepID=UPI0005F79057|nr:protein kinase [Pseudofrankia sp. DC12]